MTAITDQAITDEDLARERERDAHEERMYELYLQALHAGSWDFAYGQGGRFCLDLDDYMRDAGVYQRSETPAFTAVEEILDERYGGKGEYRLRTLWREAVDRKIASAGLDEEATKWARLTCDEARCRVFPGGFDDDLDEDDDPDDDQG